MLVVLLASFACGAPLTIGDGEFWPPQAPLFFRCSDAPSSCAVVTGRTCDVRAVQPHAIALVRQMLCEGVALASLQDVAGLELLPDSSTALVLPFLQPAARTALAAAVEGAAVPLRVMQALNTPVDAYVLWRWTLAGKCGLADSGRTFPMRPKDADDFGAGTVVQVEQPDQWEARLAAHHWFRQAGSDRFQFRAPIGQLVDVHYRQVLSWQRWFSGHNAQLGVAATGVFDATTQERMDASPAAGYPPSACRSSTPVSASARAITDPTAPPQSTSNTGDAQGALALVIAVPVGVASAFLGVLLVVELLSSFSGPRLPMTSKVRRVQYARSKEM